MTTIDTTLARYDVTTDCNRLNSIGTVARYRDRGLARIVARRDRGGVLSDIEVVVTWGGHEGRSTIDGDHTLGEMGKYLGSGYSEDLNVAIFNADAIALTGLIRSATDAHTEALGNNMEITDYTAVRDTVAAAIGAESHPSLPVTESEAREWLRSFDSANYVQFVPV